LSSGGGISGLCLAVALSRYPDIQVDVYEAAAQFKEIGAGVMIWSKTWRILELLELDTEFSKIAHSPPDGSLGI
jgi:salicylate hydroxylase